MQMYFCKQIYMEKLISMMLSDDPVQTHSLYLFLAYIFISFFVAHILRFNLSFSEAKTLGVQCDICKDIDNKNLK